MSMQTGSLINSMMSNAKPIEPKLGMGATVLGYSDRYAGTIIQVTDDSFTVQQDKAIRTDGHGMSDSQTYRYEPDSTGYLTQFRRVTRGKAKGQWRELGDTLSANVLIGHRQAYHDYSF